MMARAHFFILILAALAGWLLVVISAKAQTPLTYADWIAGFSLSPEDSLPLADPDGDGVENLLEYAFAGQSPIVPGGIIQTVLFGRRTGDALPIQDPNVITQVPGMVGYDHIHAGVEWTPRPGIEGILWIPEYSRPDSGLNKWFSGRNAVLIRPSPTDPAKLQGWSLSLTPTVLMKRFFWRIRVKQLEEPTP